MATTVVVGMWRDFGKSALGFLVENVRQASTSGSEAPSLPVGKGEAREAHIKHVHWGGGCPTPFLVRQAVHSIYLSFEDLSNVEAEDSNEAAVLNSFANMGNMKALDPYSPKAVILGDVEVVRRQNINRQYGERQLGQINVSLENARVFHGNNITVVFGGIFYYDRIPSEAFYSAQFAQGQCKWASTTITTPNESG
ncbi:hypothetical protein BDY19DRAFT_909979 [Irpex rosettiformis]|uniref:Uncharacterized protein n=1 Tax=Irpex rosettiformis TaxID=378272 RepID=A0ACB8TQN0_9APHY|nr:hypothetical protein BDY19DRAFT_909979 [Irpex rosettiformis]